MSEYKSYETKIVELENRNALLGQEIERLNVVIRGKLGEIDEWKSRYSKLELQFTTLRQLESKISEYENRIGLLTQEIERLNNVLRQRLGEIEEWKGRYSKLEIQLSHYRGYEDKVRELEERTSMLVGQLEEWKSKYSKLEITITQYRGYEGKLADYENRIALLT